MFVREPRPTTRGDLDVEIVTRSTRREARRGRGSVGGSGWSATGPATPLRNAGDRDARRSPAASSTVMVKEVGRSTGDLLDEPGHPLSPCRVQTSRGAPSLYSARHRAR